MCSKNLAQELASTFSILANKDRLGVLLLLSQHSDMSVTDLLAQLSLTQTALSNHLTKLKNAGVIDFEKKHRYRYYYLRDKNILTILKFASENWIDENRQGNDTRS